MSAAGQGTEAGIRRAGDGRQNTGGQPQSVGNELLEVNFAQLVGGMGQGIADAHAAGHGEHAAGADDERAGL